MQLIIQRAFVFDKVLEIISLKSTVQNENILQHTKEFVEVREGLTIRLGTVTRHSLHNGTQEGSTMAYKQQSFVSLDVTERNAVKMKISRWKKVQYTLCNALRSMKETFDHFKRGANKANHSFLMCPCNTIQLCIEVSTVSTSYETITKRVIGRKEILLDRSGKQIYKSFVLHYIELLNSMTCYGHATST